jgi:hypothetical protein
VISDEVDIDDAVFIRSSPLMVQKAAAFSSFATVVEALRDRDFQFDSEATAMLISRGGQISALNITGAFLWDCLDGMRTISELVDELCGVFDVNHREARQTIHLFIEGLRQQGLVSDLSPSPKGRKRVNENS